MLELLSCNLHFFLFLDFLVSDARADCMRAHQCFNGWVEVYVCVCIRICAARDESVRVLIQSVKFLMGRIENEPLISRELLFNFFTVLTLLFHDASR